MHISASALCLLYIKEAGCGIDWWKGFQDFQVDVITLQAFPNLETKEEGKLSMTEFFTLKKTQTHLH